MCACVGIFFLWVLGRGLFVVQRRFEAGVSVKDVVESEDSEMRLG